MRSKNLNNNGTVTKTFYIRDASGNVLATYEGTGTTTLKLKELMLYGSTRLGVFKPDFLVSTTSGGGISTNYLGKKQYELTNHLGNVLAVITDDRSEVDSDNNGTPNYYTPIVAEAREYYPFGMVMPNRKTPAAGNSTYRYGFNGKENDDEVYGDDNEQDYGMRIYDPRLGRFLSVDPIAKQYPELTVYQFASNTPLQAVDLDGLERYFAADGQFLGKSGTSTEIMIVTNAAVVTTAKYNLARPNWDHKWLNAHSVKGYDNPDQAALEWAFENQGKSHGRIYDEKEGIESQEYAAMIGSKETKDENGNPITLYTLGNTVGGGYMDKNSVDVQSSKTLHGWERKHGVHTHPIGKSDKKTPELFSPYRNEMGQYGDEYFPISKGINLYLATPRGFLKVIEGKEAKERAVYDRLPHDSSYDYGMPSVILKTWYSEGWKTEWTYPKYKAPILSNAKKK